MNLLSDASLELSAEIPTLARSSQEISRPGWVGILTADGFDERSCEMVAQGVQALGFAVQLVGDSLRDTVRSWDGELDEWGKYFPVDEKLAFAQSEGRRFDLLVVPGGVMSSDRLRASDEVQAFVADHYRAGGIVAAHGHGVQVVADSIELEKFEVTSAPGVRKDLERAGAHWLDQPSVIDGNLISGRGDDDLHNFVGLVGGVVSQRCAS